MHVVILFDYLVETKAMFYGVSFPDTAQQVHAQCGSGLMTSSLRSVILHWSRAILSSGHRQTAVFFVVAQLIDMYTGTGPSDRLA